MFLNIVLSFYLGMKSYKFSQKKGTENISIYDWPYKLSSGKQNFCLVKIGGHSFIFIKTHPKPP